MITTKSQEKIKELYEVLLSVYQKQDHHRPEVSAQFHIPLIPMNTRHFEELGFTVIAKPFSHHVEYKVFQIQGIGINPSTYYYNDSEDNPTESIEQAEVFAHGSVKWDGCSNWHFDEQDRVMIHGCCKEHLINLGLILSACWDWTADLIPETWSA